MKFIEDTRDAFVNILCYTHNMFVTVQNYSYYITAYFCSHATVSMTMDGCMESGKDVCQGGAKYKTNSATLTGVATIGDSLAAIKYMNFKINIKRDHQCLS